MSDRDALAGIVRDVFFVNYATPRYVDQIADAVLDAGWKSPNWASWTEELGSSAISAEAQAVRELEAERDALVETVNRVRALADEWTDWRTWEGAAGHALRAALAGPPRCTCGSVALYAEDPPRLGPHHQAACPRFRDADGNPARRHT